MKTKLNTVAAVLIVFMIGCNTYTEEPTVKVTVDTSSFSFTECNNVTKSTEANVPSVELTGKPDGMLQVKMINTEFCCGTDSVSLSTVITENEIAVQVIDLGPHTYCYCPHDLEFMIGPFDNSNYELTIIESEHAYSRDTFSISFEYSQQLDTVITGNPSGSWISYFPLNYVKTDLGGCNDSNKSANAYTYMENDTIIFTQQADTLKIFAGLNLTCCMEFGPESEISGDTLVMRINTMNNLFCDCICYYTFDYVYVNYAGQQFYYQFYVDDYKWFEGEYNLP